MSDTELRVSKIKYGTVIDHITSGHALDVVRILGITGREEGPITIAINVPSKRLKRKDIVKIEGRELKPQEVHKIALIAPHASINIIRDYNVAEKFNVEVPDIVKGIVRCQNPGCITNQSEPIEPEFVVESKKPLTLRCIYCGRIMNDVSDYLI